LCGRFTLTVDEKDFKKHFRYTVERFDYSPSYNIAPGQEVPVVYFDRDKNEIRIRSMRWGLVPHWAKEKSIGFRMINARAETADKKPAFRFPFLKRRCLIPADGFYEWQKKEGDKIPFRIALPGGDPFAFAGLYDRWVSPEGNEEIYSFTIITVEAGKSIKHIHDRMPAMLVDGKSRSAWLDPEGSVEGLKSVLIPYDGELVAYEVSKLVNSPKNNFPGVIAPKNKIR